MVDLESGVSDPPEPVSTRRLLLAYIRERQVRVDDGSVPSRFVGVALIAAFVVATVMLLFSDFSIGTEVAYLGSADSTASAALIVAALVLSGVFFAAATWQAITVNREELGARVSAWDLIPFGVAVINAAVGFALISAATTHRVVANTFEEMPSIVQVDASGGDLSLALGIGALLTCIVFLAVSSLTPRHRLVLTALAALPTILCAVSFALADRSLLVLNKQLQESLLLDSSAVAYITSSVSSKIASSPLLLLVLGSAAFLGLVLTFSVVKLTAETKSKITHFLVGRRVKTRVVAVMIGLVAVVVLSGRLGWLSDAEKARNAFRVTAPEAWIVAGLIAIAGLATIRSAVRRPVDRRNAKVVVAIAAVSVVASRLVLFVSKLVQSVVDPIVDGNSSVGRFAFERLPSWSLWFETWSVFSVAVALGLWGVWRLTQRERSDRVIFALAFAVVVFPLRLTSVLVEHQAHRGFWAYHNATPDLIMLAAVALIGLTLIVRRPLFDNTTSATVVLIGFVLVLLEAIVPDSLTVGTFQMLLVAPFVFRFAFDSSELRSNTRRAAVTMAAFGVLFVASAVQIAVGELTEATVKFGELFAFIQLAAPLALLVLCPTAPLVASAESHPAAWLKRRRVGSGVLAACFGLAAACLATSVALAVVRLPSKPDRGQYQVDVRVTPQGFEAQQDSFGSSGEAAQLSSDLGTVVAASNLKLNSGSVLEPCSLDFLAQRYGIAPAGDPRSVDPVAGLPAALTPIVFGGEVYTMLCASAVVGDGIRRVLVLEPGDALSEATRLVLESIAFRGPSGTVEENNWALTRL